MENRNKMADTPSADYVQVGTMAKWLGCGDNLKIPLGMQF